MHPETLGGLSTTKRWRPTKCSTQAVSPPTSAERSGRDAPIGGLHNPWEESDEYGENALLSLGDELAPFKQADMAEQHGEKRASGGALVTMSSG